MIPRIHSRDALCSLLCGIIPSSIEPGTTNGGSSSVDVESEQIARMIGRSAGACWDGVIEAQALEVEGVNEGIDEADRVILGDVVIQGLRDQGQLVSICDPLKVSMWTTGAG